MPMRADDDNDDRLVGQDVPRIDLPSRLMVPIILRRISVCPAWSIFDPARTLGAIRLKSVNEAAAKKVNGFH